MESELPLMEMAEEDDSLIPDLNFNQTPSKSSLNYFACSPLALPPSHTKNLKDSVCMEKPSSSSSEASNNKENINSNNVGVPKLGMESMQMKRRKKGGGYNLRKSIAWDRAFFTEEGILDPLELTLITGINANTRGGGLPTISEEGNSSFSSEVGCRNECNDMKVSEEAPLKEACDKNCISKGKKEKTRSSVGNHESLPHHRVTQKVLSISRTKRDPLAASSLKRPANSDTLKTSKKESKLTIPPISKPGSCFSATKNGSMSASQLRRNLIPKPIINVQKNVGLKSSIQNVHGSQSKAKTGLGNLHKEVAQKTLRNLTNSSKAASTTKSRLQLCEIQQESAPLAAEVLAHRTAENSRNSLPKADRLHPCESQEHPATLARPSGLRLPSPSLRFFDQSSPTPSFMVNTTKGVPDLNTSQNQEIKVIPRVDQNYDDRVPFFRQTEDKFVLHNEENILHNDNYSAGLMSKSGQTIQHQEQQNTSSGVDVSTDFTHDLAQTSEDTEKSGAFKVNPESHLWVSPGLKYDSVDEKRWQEDFTGKSINQGNFSDFNGENLLSESQSFVEVDSEVVQEGKTPMLGDFQHGLDGGSEIKIISRVDQYYDDRVAFVREAEDKFVLYNEENILHNDHYSTCLMSKSGQAIQHQEQQNISGGVDARTDFTCDLAQTSKDTEKSDAFKVNPESHLWVSPGLEYESVDEKRGEEDVTGKHTNQGNFSDFNGENQPSESQGFVEVESEVVQEGKTPVKGDFQHGLDGGSEIKIIPTVDHYDDRVAFVREEEDKFVLHNEENILHNDNYSTGLISKFGQPIQHQEQQNISSGVDVSTDLTHDLAQTSKDTEKSDAFKVNPESHLCVSPGLEYDSVDEKRGQEDVTEKNTNQGNFSDFNGENQPNEPQDFVEVDSEVVQEGKTPMLGDFQQALDGGSDLTENKDECHATMVTKSSNSIKRQDNSLVIHPPNAVPFSDEWLAAIEAAGEEILTMKCGAVQHSPPGKSLPEPGPWSPVKKKSNQIGPYDCTKYANAMPSNSQ